MKNILQILVFILFPSSLFAQEAPNLYQEEKCATDFLHKKLLLNDSVYRSNFNKAQD
ncbi:MAG: hypothetical protein QNL61_01240 [Crocinitomicaceae bacterium]